MFDQPSSDGILHLVSNMRWTGVAEPAASLAQWQIRAGERVELAAIWGRSLEQEAAARDIPLARSLDIERKINPLATMGQIRSLRCYLVEHGIRIVHTHLVHDHWLAALAIRGIRGKNRPFLARTVHRHEKMKRDPAHRWLFERASNLVITVSKEQESLIARAYSGIDGRLRVVYGGVDPEKFRPDLPGAASIRDDMGEKPASMVAGIVAHLGYNRGHKWLLKAAPEVLRQVPNAVIWIVGQGEMKHELRAEVRKPVYEGRVLMAGYRGKDLPETYATMNAALLLGLGSEGSARAALEAMASECPVIGVRKGALIDTITPDENGILVGENDVDGLAEALIRILGNRDLCAEMGKKARATILERFTEQKRFEETMRAYRDLFGIRVSPVPASA